MSDTEAEASRSSTAFIFFSDQKNAILKCSNIVIPYIEDNYFVVMYHIYNIYFYSSFTGVGEKNKFLRKE
jgi:hypothetical protein